MYKELCVPLDDDNIEMQQIMSTAHRFFGVHSVPELRSHERLAIADFVQKDKAIGVQFDWTDVTL